MPEGEREQYKKHAETIWIAYLLNILPCSIKFCHWCVLYSFLRPLLVSDLLLWLIPELSREPCFIQGSSKSSWAYGLSLKSCYRHLSMKFWHSGETFSGMAGRSRFVSLVFRARSTLASLSRRSPQGFSPVSISTRRQPSDHMSDFLPIIWF